MRVDQKAGGACFIVEPLMVDLTSVPATQNPRGPRIVCPTRIAVVTAAVGQPEGIRDVCASAQKRASI
jgi:hypothetical protein